MAKGPSSGKVLFVLVLVQLLFTSYAPPGRIITLAPYQVPVEAWDGPWMAYLITEADGQTLSWIWGIKGFDDYRWGTSYTLKIREKGIANPPTDSPGREFILLEILEATPMAEDAAFRIPVKKNYTFFLHRSREDATLSLVREVPVRLDLAQPEREVLKTLLFSRDITGTFTVEGEGLLLRELSGGYDAESAMEALFMSGLEPPDFEDGWMDRFIDTRTTEELWGMVAHPGLR